MNDDVGTTRWARELGAPNAEAARSQQARNVLALSERDLRLMREKGPGGSHYVTPPPAPWRRGVALALVVAAVFGIGAAIGTGLRALFG